MLDLVLAGAVDDWVLHLDRLPAAAQFVARVVRERYPQLNPPLHARWRHFVFGGRDLWRELAAAQNWESPAAQARAAFDLAMTSVLLDAGAGPGWTYRDSSTGLTAARSEGLALASLRWFASGGLSDHPHAAFRADAATLQRMNATALKNAFQVGNANPLLGLDGRAALLNRLGVVVQQRADLFALADSPRPGGLFDALIKKAAGNPLPAAVILEVLLDALGPIWQNRPSLEGVSLGDCWAHPALKGARAVDRYAPLHKLSQWLAYSLIEPLQHAGVTVSELDGLTGLAEYRNGGLFVDSGVLVPRDQAAWSTTYSVSDPFVVVWRATTVALLDRIAPLVTAELGLNVRDFPLGCVLEGGTWVAGRLLAREKRLDGGPPFHITSDGTVF
jgi:Protein of unknown function (DUF1688)